MVLNPKLLHRSIVSCSGSSCKRIFFCLGLLLSLSSAVFTQDKNISWELKGGFTFASISGPAEKIGNTRITENFSYQTGLHASVGFTSMLTRHSGLRLELMFNRRGTNYNFTGQSYWFFETPNHEELFSFGTRKTELSITTDFLEMPLLYFVRANRVELSGGVSMGYLIDARGKGKLVYSGITEGGSTVAPFNIRLDFDYLKDPLEPLPAQINLLRSLDGQIVEIPQTIGAYYEASNSEARRFHRFDAQIIAGISFFLSEELFIGLRINYGITDLTNNLQDISMTQVNSDKSLIRRSDYDRNFAFQSSIGLRF